MEYCDCEGCGRRLPVTPKRKYKLKIGKSIYCSARCYRETNGFVIGGHKGICETCGKEFVSRIAGKKYCDIKCYQNDPRTIDRLREISNIGIAAKCAKLGISDFGTATVLCAHCGAEIEVVKSRLKRTGRFFCSVGHYREFLSSRFDRWIASPQSVALPQNYDEFMAQNELPCPIDGCGWTGKHLSSHVNLEHGIQSDEFKMMVGFNLKTGLVTKDVSETMSKKAVQRGPNGLLPNLGEFYFPRRYNYVSLEGKEHREKARLLRIADQ